MPNGFVGVYKYREIARPAKRHDRLQQVKGMVIDATGVKCQFANATKPVFDAAPGLLQGERMTRIETTETDQAIRKSSDSFYDVVIILDEGIG